MTRTRRNILLAGLPASAFLLMGQTCSAPTPEQIQAGIKAGCGILVPVADISVLITKGGSLTIDAWVNAICSAYKTQLANAPTSGLAASASGKVVVHTAGGDVTIDYTK